MCDYPPVDAPFGSWSMDRKLNELTPFRAIHSVGHGFVCVFQEKIALKVFHKGDPVHELRMMVAAGSDCSVQPLGRVFNWNYKLIGFTMPFEQALAPGDNIGGEPGQRPVLSKEQKRDIIQKLCRLMERLHAKGLIHGDVKPSNILLCSDGEVRLCDWALASTKEEKTIPYAMSVHYSSPRRCALPFEYLTAAEDMYGTGVSIWEIWVEEIPFKDVTEDLVEDIVRAGQRPDLRAIDDPAIAALITSCLDAGPPFPTEEEIIKNRMGSVADSVQPYIHAVDGPTIVAPANSHPEATPPSPVKPTPECT